jgi:hypothetical protein
LNLFVNDRLSRRYCVCVCVSYNNIKFEMPSAANYPEIKHFSFRDDERRKNLNNCVALTFQKRMQD